VSNRRKCPRDVPRPESPNLRYCHRNCLFKWTSRESNSFHQNFAWRVYYCDPYRIATILFATNALSPATIIRIVTRSTL
jgi:hypothetical protein